MSNDIEKVRYHKLGGSSHTNIFTVQYLSGYGTNLIFDINTVINRKGAKRENFET